MSKRLEIFKPPIDTQEAKRKALEYASDYKFYLRCYRVLSKKGMSNVLYEIALKLDGAESGYRYYDRWARIGV